jgi:hypothetical protein
MTSPIGEPGRHQAAPDDEIPGEDPIVLDNSRTAPGDDARDDDLDARDDDLVVLDNGRTSPGDGVPDDGPVVLEGELMVDDDRAASGDYRIAPGDRITPGDDQFIGGEDDPAAEMPASDSASAASVPAGAAPAAAVSPVDIPAGGTAAATVPPAAVPAGAADGGPGRESPATDNADNAGSARRWPDIQAMFVDDPRASVEQAAGLVDDCVEALVVSVKERQHALLSDWQGTGTDTEQLRTALQRYRTFWSRLEDFSRQS